MAEDSDKIDTERVAAGQGLATEAQQAERRANAARGRVELARKLAIEKAKAAGHPFPDPLNSAEPQATPSRNLSTTAAGDPRANAQRIARIPTA